MLACNSKQLQVRGGHAGGSLPSRPTGGDGSADLTPPRPPEMPSLRGGLGRRELHAGSTHRLTPAIHTK